MENNKQFSIYNFGSGTSLSVSEIIETIQKIAGTNKKVISEYQERQNEIMNVVADIQNAKKDLDWKPIVSFEDGIREVIKIGLENK